MSTSDSLEDLYQRWLQDQLSPDETERFFTLIDELETPPAFMQKGWDKFAGPTIYTPEEKTALAEKILSRGRIKELLPQTKRLIPIWLSYAAAILIVACAGTYWFLTSPTPKTTASYTSNAKDVLPGGNRAMLVLGDESVIDLDTATNGQLATQGGSSVIKTANGELLYTNNAGGQKSNVFYQKLITPRGGQYQVTLADGTQVWLNAASSIRFPSQFVGTTREVEVTGEVYFEVAANATMPFKVKLNNQAAIEVLGTSFNVKAYNEEPLARTTLLSGKIKVSRNNESQLLDPGSQAVINKKITLSKNVDIEQVMAWKNGLFNFSRSDVASMMLEIGRWYDLDIVYDAQPTGRHITGKIQRNLTLSQLMNVLSGLDIHCRLEGRKLILAD